MFIVELIKRGILVKIVKVYDLFGLVLLVILFGKVFYREVCDIWSVWDGFLVSDLKGKWNKWE